MHRSIPFVLAAVLCIPLAALAQDWRGDGRLHGRVLTADGAPAAGAVVRVLPAGREQGPGPATTDADGRWSISGLAPGVWTMTVDAEGHVVSRGRVGVSAGGAGRVIRIRLRSLEELGPYAAEGNPNAVLDWIDKGNSFLRDGRFAEARVEYERALRELPWREHADVLQGLARTHFMEGNRERALALLHRALSIEPTSVTLRQLLRGVLAGLGRADEAEALLSALPSEPREPAAYEHPAPPPPLPGPTVWEQRPVLDAEPHRPGRYRMRVTERSALGALERYATRHGATVEQILEIDPRAGGYRVEDEVFEVFVPSSYDAARPHALFVWVSPTRFGGIETPELQGVLAERDIVWIGANDAGNERARWDRVALALDAADAMQRLYTVDPARVWIGGYSGGARTAGGLALQYGEVFRGGLYLMGCDFYRDLPVSHRPGARWPAAFRKPEGDAWRALRARHRFAIVTGTRDFNRSSCRTVHEAYLEDGFRGVVFFEVPGISHYDRLPPAWWARAFDHLRAD